MSRVVAMTLVLLALLATGCAHRSWTRSRGLEPLQSTEESLSEALRPRRLAVVVGVDAYQDPAFPRLHHAESDARAVATALEAKVTGGFDEVALLESPGRTALLDALRTLELGLRAEDSVVVYFSGHGTLAQEDGRTTLYLLPTDATAGALRESALELDVLEDWFGALRAIRKALILDACFNGVGKSVVAPSMRVQASDLLAERERVRLSALGSGEVHLYGATLGRPALEDDQLGHGVYTWFLLQAMSWARPQADADGDGLITAFEAHDWARGRTMEHTEGVQVPEASMRVVGRNDLALVGGEAERAERDHALVFDYRGARFDGATLVVDGRARGSFPGTVALSAGMHHIELRATDGELLADGYARVPARASVPVRDLPVLVREDRVLLSVRPTFGTGPARSWGPLWGPGFLGLELAGGVRKARGGGRGLLFTLRLGGGVSPTREGLEGLVRRGRGLLWGAGGLGWAGGPRRLRIRATWDAQATLLPLSRLPGESHVTLPAEAGWLIFSSGPSATVGLATGRRTTLVLGGTAQFTPMRSGPSVPVRLHTFGLVHAGLEVAL